MRFVLCFAAIAALSACASVDIQPPANQPPAFRTGWDGDCRSGYSAGGNPYYAFARDADAYAADPLYRQGWDAGFENCRTRYTNLGQLMR